MSIENTAVAGAEVAVVAAAPFYAKALAAVAGAVIKHPIGAALAGTAIAGAAIYGGYKLSGRPTPSLKFWGKKEPAVQAAESPVEAVAVVTTK